jgi:hypothetical protein
MMPVFTRSSGLPMTIWIGPRGRIKVHSASIDNRRRGHRRPVDRPDLAAIRRRLLRNRQALLDYSAEKTDGIELARALRSR